MGDDGDYAVDLEELASNIDGPSAPRPVTRLIHLNGPPGIGKSTLARRYAADHPGVLDCDIDLLRTLVGGWESRFGESGALIRPAALAMITAYLSGGHDVVLPQMLVRAEELARFEAAAVAAGSVFVERFVMDTEDDAVARFHRRGADATAGGPVDEWHDQVRAIVAADGGDESLRRYNAALETLLRERPRAVVVPSVDGRVDETYAALVATLAEPTRH